MFSSRVALVVAAAGVMFAASAARAAEPREWDDTAVAKAIERGRQWLWSQWNEAEGHWPERYGRRGAYVDGPGGCNYGGVTSLCLYAILAAGESPQDPRVEKTLRWLSKVPMHGVYARGMRANVWGMLGRESKYRKFLIRDVRWLINSMYYRIGKYPDGSYPYLGPKPGTVNANRQDRSNWDNSNSQIAVLGVWAGARNGVEVPLKYWRTVEKHWTKVQKGDGGWDYAKPSRWKIKNPNRGYGAMTAAGLATLFICLDNLHRADFVRCRANTDTVAILKGLKWMERNFSPRGNPGLRSNGVNTYYLYGVERVGLASGYKYFGKKDWYKQGARVLMSLMRNDGSVGGSLVDTSFSLLFLARGRHPVLFNKLRYEGMWNCRPRDLANLTRWISSTFETTVNWQIINLQTDVSEWHDAPILYISGASAPKFTDAQLDKLRTFVHQGGVVLSEAACNSAAFDKAMTSVYARLFPDYELKSLSTDHPLYTLHYKTPRGRRLKAVSNGVRLLAIHSPRELSNAWQLNLYSSAADLFRQAANIYFFVTDKGSLRRRGVSHWPRARSFQPAGTVKLAVVRHRGNWNPEPLALRRFALLMGNRHKVKVELSAPVSLAELNAAEQPVAVMTGTGALTLTPEELAGLKKYLGAGGTLIADAAGGSKAFAEAMERQLANLLPGASYRRIPRDHALYTKAGPAIEKVRYRRALRVAFGASSTPRLRGLFFKDRLAVIFSPEDLTAGLVGYACWGLKGYQPDSAFALMRNAVLYATGKTVTSTR